MTEITDDDRLFITKIKNILPTDDERTMMICTLLGTSGVLSEYIMQDSIDKRNIEQLPIMVKYACAIICGNMIALISDGKKGNIKNLGHDEYYKMGEQTQEIIYRKMKWVVETLYKDIQENEKN